MSAQLRTVLILIALCASVAVGRPGRGSYSGKTAAAKIPEKRPAGITLDSLQANTRYYYRLCYRESGQGRYAGGARQTFHTQPQAGSAFTFGVQGDSHPDLPPGGKLDLPALQRGMTGLHRLDARPEDGRKGGRKKDRDEKGD